MRWCEHEGSDVQEACEDPGRRDFQQKTEFQQKSVYRVHKKTAPQAFKDQRNHGGIQRRGDARVHERNREIASACVDGHRAAVQEKKKEMGHRRSYREQQPRWWC